MLKNLLNSSIILATSGFILLCASAPDESKNMIANFVNKAAEFSAKHRTSLHPNSYTAEYGYNPAYTMSLSNKNDYYDIAISQATLLR